MFALVVASQLDICQINIEYVYVKCVLPSDRSLPVNMGRNGWTDGQKPPCIIIFITILVVDLDKLTSLPDKLVSHSENIRKLMQSL